MVSLQIDMLGGFEMRLASGAQPEFGQRKAQAILAYLSLAPDYTVPRARLVNLLWSERGEAQARSSLRQALAALKKGLREAEQMPLESGRETVALLGGHVAVDALDFERLAESDDVADLEAAAALIDPTAVIAVITHTSGQFIRFQPGNIGVAGGPIPMAFL